MMVKNEGDSLDGCRIIDERIESYTKMIEQEKNPVFKMLYELNRNLLVKLKNVEGRDRAIICTENLVREQGAE
jgi:hypothetical protein